MSPVANYMPQFSLDCLWRCLKLFIHMPTVIPSSRAFASKFGLAIFVCEKKTSA